MFQFYLMYRLICRKKPAHFLSVQMALVSTFFQMFIVLGIYNFASVKDYITTSLAKFRYLKTPLTVTLTKRIELLKFLNQSVCFDKNNNNKQTNKTCYHWLDMQIVNWVVQKFEHGKCQQGFPLVDLISFSKVSNILS